MEQLYAFLEYADLRLLLLTMINFDPSMEY